MTKTNNNTKIETTFEDLQKKVNALSDTSKKIRFLVSHYKSMEVDSPIAETEKMLKLLGVTTKKGDPIRYQHVRNVAITPLSSK